MWGRNKRVHAFPKSICPKVNLIAQLEFRLTYFVTVVQHFSNYAAGTPPLIHHLWCYRSFNNRLSRSGDPTRINNFSTCIPATTIHELALFIHSNFHDSSNAPHPSIYQFPYANSTQSTAEQATCKPLTIHFCWLLIGPALFYQLYLISFFQMFLLGSINAHIVIILVISKKLTM